MKRKELRLSQNSCGDEINEFYGFMRRFRSTVRVDTEYHERGGLFDENGEEIEKNSPDYIDYWELYCNQ